MTESQKEYIITEEQLNEHARLSRRCGYNDMSEYRVGNIDHEPDLLELETTIRSRPYESSDKVLEPTYDEMVEHIRWTQTLWKKGIEIMRTHNIVIDNLDDKMQKLAFTFYSDLCEINSKAEHLFEEGWGDKYDKVSGELRQKEREQP